MHLYGITAQAATTMSSGITSTSSGHSHGEMGMMAVFFNSMDTSLYSTAWTPSSTAGYAGTCIFLVLLAALFRALLAGKSIMEQRWLDQELARRYVAVRGKQPFAETVSQDSMAKDMVLSANGVEENVRVVERKRTMVRPFRLTVDPVRACLDMVIAGVGYLLMLAVMTMNVGYFMSVLGGVFVGSLAVGRFIGASEH